MSRAFPRMQSVNLRSTQVLTPAQITSVAGTMTLSLDPAQHSFTPDALETGTGSKTLTLVWASVKDLQALVPELRPSLLHQEDLAPKVHQLTTSLARMTMTAIHRMRSRTRRWTALLQKIGATGLGANTGPTGTTTTEPVVKSATAQSHAMDLSALWEQPARWDNHQNDQSSYFDINLVGGAIQGSRRHSVQSSL